MLNLSMMMMTMMMMKLNKKYYYYNYCASEVYAWHSRLLRIARSTGNYMPTFYRIRVTMIYWSTICEFTH